MRKSLPESPRWLEAVGRTEEAEALMQSIEREAAQGRPLPAPAAAPSTVAVSATLRRFSRRRCYRGMIVARSA